MASTPSSMLHIITQGLQDIERLNTTVGQPSIKFYTSVIRQRTRWASYWRRVEFDNLADFGKTATVTLPILGELITRATLVIKLPDIATPQEAAAAAAASYSFGNTSCLIGPVWSWTNGVGHSICSNASFSIGSQVIDQVDSRLLEVLDEQNGPIEHLDSTNKMIARDPVGYSQYAYRGIHNSVATQQTSPQTLEIVFPFWWNRGPGPQALPIQALAKEKVQISVTFRSMQDSVYTDARTNPLNPGAEASQVGPLPQIAGCGFYQVWPAGEGGQPIHDMTREPFSCGFANEATPYLPTGRVLPGVTMPTRWHFQDAYWIIEYVSLEEREAAAFRTADLQIPIEQHVAIPPVQTAGAQKIRIPIAQGGLVRELSWVAQREEATDYNAYFLFSRDLGPQGASGSFIPWWPDAFLPDWNYGDGYIRPGFSDRRSDPFSAATLWTQGVRRFEHEGLSLLRSVVPSLNCKRAPLINRYIYRYDFGFWPSGGLIHERERDEFRGATNWDKITKKELALTLNLDDLPSATLAADSSQISRIYTGAQMTNPAADFRSNQGYHVELRGFGGAIIRGMIDMNSFPRGNLYVRITPAGSAGIVVEKSDGTFAWIAMTGANSRLGGVAGSAIDMGYRADRVQTHEANADGTYGGAGGIGLTDGQIGLPDGQIARTDRTWLFDLTSTGGTTGIAPGGDGYWGGGSGQVGPGTSFGGGGGGYISPYITQVETTPGVTLFPYPTARVTLTALVSKTVAKPRFTIYSWLTTYNLLRITNGRGALMFSA
jgi:hypothetical protein